MNKKIHIGTLVTIISLAITSFAAGELDPSFRASAYGSSVNGSVTVMRRQADGKLLVGGVFTELGTRAAGGIGRLSADGTVDETFNPPMFGFGGGLGGSVQTIAVQADGKILVGGLINGFDEVPTFGPYRLNADGSIDGTFSRVVGGTISDIEVLANGQILVAGTLSINQTNKSLIRLNADGSYDASFASGFNQGITEIEVDSDGSIFAGGGSLYKLNGADGAQVAGFVPPTFSGTIEVIRALGNGSAFVGGSFTTVLGFQTGGLAKINSNGSVDLTFNQNQTGANGTVYDILLLPNSQLLISGTFTAYNGTQRQKVARLNTDGSLDLAFQSSAAFVGLTIRDVESLNSGSILAGLDNGTILKLDNTGTPDPNYLVTATRLARVNKVLQQSDGKILVAGQFKYLNGVLRNGLARLNPDGSVDTSFVPYFFNSASLASITAIAVQPDGKVIISGIPGTSQLIRLNVDGSLDISFGSFSGDFSQIAVLSNGQILVSGSNVAATGSYSIARFNANGSLDSSFGTVQPNGRVSSFVVQGDGKIAIGGSFGQVGSTLRGRVARLNSDGSLDTSFNPPGGVNGGVLSVAVQSDGKIVVGGGFTAANGMAGYINLARFNTDGSLDSSFQPTANENVLVVVLQNDGKILIGGSFTSVNGSPKRGLARLNTNGTIDPTFIAQPYVAGNAIFVRDIAIQTDGKVLVGGDFPKVNGQSAVRVARLLNALVSRRVPFDFDGDGKSDIGITRPNGGIEEWWISRSSDSNVFATVFGVPSDIPTPGDFTGDGKADIALFRPSTGQWFVLRSDDFSYLAFPFGTNGDIPMPADYDGDGKTDPAVFRPSQGTWFISRTSDNQTTIAQFGVAGDKPVSADYDGDGKADMAVYRLNNGAEEWWIQRSAAGLFATVFGVSGDKAVPGDYTGDGKVDVAVWRPSNGNWFILRSEDLSFLAFPWGANGDLPAPGDYDGDGKTDAAVFRASQSTWFINRTGGQGPLITSFGAPTDSPVAGAYVR